MRKVDLKIMEQFNYDIIKNLIDNNGNKLNASIKLNLSSLKLGLIVIVFNLKLI